MIDEAKKSLIFLEGPRVLRLLEAQRRRGREGLRVRKPGAVVTPWFVHGSHVVSVGSWPRHSLAAWLLGCLAIVHMPPGDRIGTYGELPTVLSLRDHRKLTHAKLRCETHEASKPPTPFTRRLKFFGLLVGRPAWVRPPPAPLATPSCTMYVTQYNIDDHQRFRHERRTRTGDAGVTSWLGQLDIHNGVSSKHVYRTVRVARVVPYSLCHLYGCMVRVPGIGMVPRWKQILIHLT
ncbi:hypothetical protein F4818DRAFT_313365 [Hypoxylon cercidicola]|nr:hypothetical protein F4818DRAFT_313365 [Hypoxylon cercidicola]